MIISAIAAVATNGIIGVNNDLPWNLPADLKWFRQKTLNHHVILGRKSFESLPGPLPKRHNIIVTRNKRYFHSVCTVTHSVGEAIRFAHRNGETELFILGGGKIYEQTLPLWDRLYLTEVQASPKGDTRFPLVDLDNFKLVFNEPHKADENHRFSFNFKIYERIK